MTNDEILSAAAELVSLGEIDEAFQLLKQLSDPEKKAE